MKNEFPKYYRHKSVYLYHKLETVDSVDIEKEKIYYRGIIMQSMCGKYNVWEDCTFTHSGNDEWEEITETEFNSEYYLLKAMAAEGEFPKYYRSSNWHSVYKCNRIDYVDPTTKRVFYQGEIVCYYPNGQGINEDAIFDLPKINCQITEKEFNDAYKSVKDHIQGSRFPVYFYCPLSHNCIKALKTDIDSQDDKEAYIGPMINPEQGYS